MAAKTSTGGFGIGFRRGWSDWQKDTAGWIVWAKAQGFTCLDVGGETDTIKAVLDAGLGIGSVDLTNLKALITEDASRRAEAVEANLKLIDAAADLGVTRFFTCLLPSDPSLPRARNFELCVEGYRPVVEKLAARGARLAIEGYPGAGALCCNPETCRPFFAAFEGDTVGINYDPSHLLRMNIDPMRFLREFIDRIVHVHGKDTQIDTQKVYDYGTEQGYTFEKPVGFGGTFWRYCLPGHGVFAWDQAFAILDAAGYDGFVSIELEDDRFNGSTEGEQRGLLAAKAMLESF